MPIIGLWYDAVVDDEIEHKIVHTRSSSNPFCIAYSNVSHDMRLLNNLWSDNGD